MSTKTGRIQVVRVLATKRVRTRVVEGGVLREGEYVRLPLLAPSKRLYRLPADRKALNADLLANRALLELVYG